MRILTLISKFPWPLTDGAVIRDFNLLREAAKRHEVFLLCFLFKPSDREQFDVLRPFCKKIVGLDLVRTKGRAIANAAKALSPPIRSLFVSTGGPRWRERWKHTWTRNVST